MTLLITLVENVDPQISIKIETGSAISTKMGLSVIEMPAGGGLIIQQLGPHTTKHTN